MERREFIVQLVTACGLSVISRDAFAFSLSQDDAASGIRTALERGAQAAVSQLGVADGFLGNPKVKIPLPDTLKSASKALKLVGQQDKVDSLVTAMNRAAESAVPVGQDVLLDAARNISVKDALKIVQGNNTAVTDYFVRTTREPLTAKFLPIVGEASKKVSLVEHYNAVAGKAANLGLVKKKDANVDQYVTRKALDGLFLVIGEEEKKIRKDPLSTGSDLLKKVFG
jgi:hypothetical protein